MRPIDADALKDELELADFETDSRMFGGQTVLFEDSVFKIVDSAPTLSPDEVRGVGEWVDKGVRAWSCSCCGTPLNHIRQFASFEKNELPNYCPNCGAKMKGAEDGTTDNT